MNIEDLTAKEVDKRVLDGIERFGPLCLSQIFTQCSVTPEQAQASVNNLFKRGIIETCPDENLEGPEDLTVVYGLPTGHGKTGYRTP